MISYRKLIAVTPISNGQESLFPTNPNGNQGVRVKEDASSFVTLAA